MLLNYFCYCCNYTFQALKFHALLRFTTKLQLLGVSSWGVCVSM